MERTSAQPAGAGESRGAESSLSLLPTGQRDRAERGRARAEKSFSNSWLQGCGSTPCHERSTMTTVALQQQSGQTQALTNLSELLTRYKEQIAMALPRHLTPERMIRVA